MNIADIQQQFTTQLQQTSPAEFVAVFFGMLSVLLASRNHVLLYPTGIISTILFFFIFVRPGIGLYADALLNGYYLVMSIYGWIKWQRNHESERGSAISYSDPRDIMITLSIVGIGFALLYYMLSEFTDSNVPGWDAIVSATAWAGMWLLARHKMENWIWLNISNAIAIPLYLKKELPLTALFTLFLFIVAVFGYFRWRKLYLHPKTARA